MDRLDGWRRALAQWGTIVREVNLRLCCNLGDSDRCAGYGPLIRTYVQFILAKLRFHRLRPEFNGLFEYEEYVTLKGIDDPNEGYVVLRNCDGP